MKIILGYFLFVFMRDCGGELESCENQPDICYHEYQTCKTKLYETPEVVIMSMSCSLAFFSVLIDRKLGLSWMDTVTNIVHSIAWPISMLVGVITGSWVHKYTVNAIVYGGLPLGMLYLKWAYLNLPLNFKDVFLRNAEVVRRERAVYDIRECTVPMLSFINLLTFAACFTLPTQFTFPGIFVITPMVFRYGSHLTEPKVSQLPFNWVSNVVSEKKPVIYLTLLIGLSFDSEMLDGFLPFAKDNPWIYALLSLTPLITVISIIRLMSLFKSLDLLGDIKSGCLMESSGGSKISASDKGEIGINKSGRFVLHASKITEGNIRVETGAAGLRDQPLSIYIYNDIELKTYEKHMFDDEIDFITRAFGLVDIIMSAWSVTKISRDLPILGVIDEAFLNQRFTTDRAYFDKSWDSIIKGENKIERSSEFTSSGRFLRFKSYLMHVYSHLGNKVYDHAMLRWPKDRLPLGWLSSYGQTLHVAVKPGPITVVSRDIVEEETVSVSVDYEMCQFREVVKITYSDLLVNEYNLVKVPIKVKRMGPREQRFISSVAKNEKNRLIQKKKEVFGRDKSSFNKKIKESAEKYKMQSLAVSVDALYLAYKSSFHKKHSRNILSLERFKEVIDKGKQPVKNRKLGFFYHLRHGKRVKRIEHEVRVNNNRVSPPREGVVNPLYKKGDVTELSQRVEQKYWYLLDKFYL